jgi:hypothetical protein
VKRILLFLAPFLLGALGVSALDVKDYDPAVNDRFTSGYPEAPIPNNSPKFIGKGLDWSGVGWWKREPQRAVALISSRHFTYTRHLAPEVGDTITFLGGDGHLHEFHVARLDPVELGKNSAEPLYADTGVGTFTETVPLDAQIAHYPIAFSRKGMDGFISRKLFMYGRTARIGANEIVEGIMLNGVGSEYNFRTTGLSPGMGRSEVGDSGSPAFIVIDGRLALIGTHWKNDTDCMVSGLIPTMNSIMAATGDKLDILPIGE